MSKNDIGIDLGTANTLIYIKNSGIVLCEPSVVAVDDKTGKVLSAGYEAKSMLGRTPDGIRAVRPVKCGVISDFDYAVAMLRFFIKKVSKRHRSVKPKVVICAPSGITSVEAGALEQAVSRLGARSVVIVREAMAAALGCGIDVSAPCGSMVVDIGAGSSEIAVISLGGIVTFKTIRFGGDLFDESIIRYIRRKYGVLIGESSAESLRINIGTVLGGCRETKEYVYGRNLITGMPEGVCVSAEDIRRAIVSRVSEIVDSIKSVLEDTAPELSSDILKNGIFLTGGGALTAGLDRFICNATSMPVRIAGSPLESVALGAGMML